MTTLVQREIMTTLMTDHIGLPVVSQVGYREPHPGSILLTEGWYGTAWQRHFSDGLWHSSRGGTPRTWAQLLKKRNVVLIYDADSRKDR